MGKGITMRDSQGQFHVGGESFETRSPDETRAFGAMLAQSLAEGDFIALDGELASGKTCFVQGLAAGLGYSGPVTSPTFTLLHLYEGGRLPVYHFDVYRLKAPEELENIGYEEYFYGDGVCVVEWSDLAADYLPKRRIRLMLERAPESEALDGSAPAASSGAPGGERRRITMTLYGGAEAWQHLTCLFR